VSSVRSCERSAVAPASAPASRRFCACDRPSETCRLDREVDAATTHEARPMRRTHAAFVRASDEFLPHGLTRRVWNAAGEADRLSAASAQVRLVHPGSAVADAGDSFRRISGVIIQRSARCDPSAPPCCGTTARIGCREPGLSAAGFSVLLTDAIANVAVRSSSPFPWARKAGIRKPKTTPLASRGSTRTHSVHRLPSTTVGVKFRRMPNPCT